MGRPAGWMKNLTSRGAMRSPGAPSHRREIELLIQGRNGQIQSKDSHGNDNFPPKGQHMARCTAPVEGHRSSSAAAACPACRGRSGRYSGCSSYGSYSPPSY